MDIFHQKECERHDSPKMFDGLKVDLKLPLQKIISYLQKQLCFSCHFYIECNLSGFKEFHIDRAFITVPGNIFYSYKPYKFTGKFISWHENGQKHIEADYVDGDHNGFVRIWDQDSNLISTTQYAGTGRF